MHGTFLSLLSKSCSSPSLAGPEKSIKSIKCASNFFFFFHSYFLLFPKDSHTFSRWEAEQIVLGGWTFVVLIYGDVGCPEAVGVLPTQQSREFAVFLLFPLFFYFLPRLTACWHPLLLPFVFPPWPFSFFRSLSWKIILARWGFFFFNYYCSSLAWSVRLKGDFSPQRKRHHIYCEKSLYMMSFPPSCPNWEQQHPRKGGKAVLEGAAMPAVLF